MGGRVGTGSIHCSISRLPLSTPGRPARRQLQPGAAAPANRNHREDTWPRLPCRISGRWSINWAGNSPPESSAARSASRLGIKAPSAIFGGLSDGPKQRTNLESQAGSFSSESALHSPMPVPEQSAIAATHERQTRLDQANGAIAEIMGLPAPFRNSVGPKQPSRYRAIAVSFDAAIKRPYREDKPLASLKRQAGMRRCERPLLNG